MKFSAWKVAILGICFWSAALQAADTYLTGHISNVTFAGGTVMVMLDNGVPDNCIGASHGWMHIPASEKPMQAFVIGLWMRGDAAQTSVTIYTTGMSSGQCSIGQLDPVN